MDKSFDLQSFLKTHEKRKIKPDQSVKEVVKKRRENSIRHRKSSRLSQFDSIRNLPIEVPKTISEVERKAEHRRMQMEKWKEEKERKRKEAATHKKKPFVTGIVHAPLKYVPPPPLKTMPSTSGRITRSQSSKPKKPQPPTLDTSSKLTKATKPATSFAPKNHLFKPPKLKNSVQLPELGQLDKYRKEKIVISFDPVNHNEEKECSKNSQKVPKSSNSRALKAAKSKTTRSLKQNDDKIQISKDTTPKSESSSEERLRSPKSSSFEECLVPRNSFTNTPKTPENLTDPKNISPCVTLSRGKDNARKEMKKKIEEGLLDDDSRDMESVEYFSTQLNSEVTRITEMCDSWDKLSQQLPLTESAMEMLLGAVGQGRLLVSQKLAQFGSLISKCAHPEPGAALVTPADLQGFWDMVFMQVENVDMRFKKLAELRDRNWVEEVPVLPTRKAAKAVKKNTKPAATSRIRDMIAAARKAKKEQTQTEPENPNPEPESKTFEAGFFSVCSPLKSPRALSTPSKPSLLKDVLSNEAKKASASKNSAASLAMLRASFIGKNVDSPDITSSEMTTPKATVNLAATPGKSILKSTNIATSKRKSRKKSIKVVLFSDSEMDSQDIKNDSFTEVIGNGDIAEDYITQSSSAYDDLRDQEIYNKENKNKAKLRRQNALDGDNVSPVLTRSRRKSLNTPLLDISGNVENKRKSRKIKEKTEDRDTPKRSTRKTKTAIEIT